MAHSSELLRCNYASQKQINGRWKKLNPLKQVRFKISVMNWNYCSESPFWFESPEIIIIWAFPAFLQHVVIKPQFVVSLKSARFFNSTFAIRNAAQLGSQTDHGFAPLVLISWKHTKKVRNIQNTLAFSSEIRTDMLKVNIRRAKSLQCFQVVQVHAHMHKKVSYLRAAAWDN